MFGIFSFRPLLLYIISNKDTDFSFIINISLIHCVINKSLIQLFIFHRDIRAIVSCLLLCQI